MRPTFPFGYLGSGSRNISARESRRGQAGGQDRPRPKEGGEQSAEDRTGDEGEDQPVIDQSAAARGPLTVVEPAEQVLGAAPQVAGAHGGGASAACKFSETLDLDGAGKGDEHIGQGVQISLGQEGDHQDDQALRRQDGLSPVDPAGAQAAAKPLGSQDAQGKGENGKEAGEDPAQLSLGQMDASRTRFPVSAVANTCPRFK